MTQSTPDTMLWLSDNRGLYLPRGLAASFIDRDQHVTGISSKEWTILEAGPDHEWYWDTWSDVCDKAVVTDDNGAAYSLYQDGDLWLIPNGMEWSEEHGFFVWPDAESDLG